MFLEQQYHPLLAILYIIYVAALEIVNLQGKLFLYADDTTLIISETNWKISLQDWEENKCEINKIWFLKRNLILNFNKTKYIAFSEDIKEFILGIANKIRIHGPACSSKNVCVW